jgi:hypothetical protein
MYSEMVLNFDSQNLYLIAHHNMAALSHRKPAFTKVTCDSCVTQVSNKIYAL